MPIESHAKILVVEDDATVRNLVLTALEAQSFDLLAESTGRGAIASAATNAPDVVLLDLGLPDIDGIELYACGPRCRSSWCPPEAKTPIRSLRSMRGPMIISPSRFR